MQKSSSVIVGKIMSTHGLDGWLAIESYTYPPEQIKNYELYINKESKSINIKIEDIKIMPKKIIVKIENYDSINAVDYLIGNNLLINEDQLPNCAEDEYYWKDLVGTDVYDSSKKYVGTVDFVFNNGANDVLAVRIDKAVNYIAFIDRNFIQISKESIILSNDAF